MVRGERCESVGMGGNFCSIGRRRGASLTRSTDERGVRGFSHGLGGQPAGSHGVPGSGEVLEKRNQGRRLDPDTLVDHRFPCIMIGLDEVIFGPLFSRLSVLRSGFCHLRDLVLIVLR